MTGLNSCLYYPASLTLSLTQRLLKEGAHILVKKRHMYCKGSPRQRRSTQQGKEVEWCAVQGKEGFIPSDWTTVGFTEEVASDLITTTTSAWLLSLPRGLAVTANNNDGGGSVCKAFLQTSLWYHRIWWAEGYFHFRQEKMKAQRGFITSSW